MWKIVGGVLLILVSLVAIYEARSYWDVLTTGASFIIGAAAGGSLTAGLLLLFWRPPHPATRYEVNLPSPYDRKRWR